MNQFLSLVLLKAITDANIEAMGMDTRCENSMAFRLLMMSKHSVMYVNGLKVFGKQIDHER